MSKKGKKKASEKNLKTATAIAAIIFLVIEIIEKIIDIVQKLS